MKYGYLARPWIRPLAELKLEVDTELRREKVARRNRRLRAGEEDTVLAVAHPRLYRVIVAALDTGCRVGELLGLRWQEVSLDRCRKTGIRDLHFHDLRHEAGSRFLEAG